MSSVIGPMKVPNQRKSFTTIKMTTSFKFGNTLEGGYFNDCPFSKVGVDCFSFSVVGAMS